MNNTTLSKTRLALLSLAMTMGLSSGAAFAGTGITIGDGAGITPAPVVGTAVPDYGPFADVAEVWADGIAIGTDAVAQEGYRVSANEDLSGDGNIDNWDSQPTIAIGRNANASGSTNGLGDGAIAIGNDSNADFRGTAIGQESRAGVMGTAIGYASETAGDGTAVGRFSYSDFGGTATGDYATAGLDGLASGRYASATGTGSTALGVFSEATAYYSVSLGAGSVADEPDTVSVGGVRTRFDDITGLPDGTENFTRRITGLSDATGATDAVNFRQFEEGIASAFAHADNLFANIEFPAAEGTTGGGTSTVVNVENNFPVQDQTDRLSQITLTAANAYTDRETAATLRDANRYTDEETSKTLTSANNYTDQEVQRSQEFVMRETRQMVEGVEDRAVSRANTYTDMRVGQVEKRMSAGIAAVAASPQLPVLDVGESAIAVGAGHFNGESALGVAFGFQPSERVNVYGGVSSGFTGASKAVYRAGASLRL